MMFYAPATHQTWAALDQSPHRGVALLTLMSICWAQLEHHRRHCLAPDKKLGKTGWLYGVWYSRVSMLLTRSVGKVCGGCSVVCVHGVDAALLMLDPTDGLDLRSLTVRAPVLPVLVFSAVLLTLHDVLPAPVAWELITHKTTHIHTERVPQLSASTENTWSKLKAYMLGLELTRHTAHAWSPLPYCTSPWPAERGNHHTALYSDPGSFPSHRSSCGWSGEPEDTKAELHVHHTHIHLIKVAYLTLGIIKNAYYDSLTYYRRSVCWIKWVKM